MPNVRAVLRPAAVASTILLALASPGRCDTLTEFRAAVEEAAIRYHEAITTVETGGQDEAAEATRRLRQAWQEINERFGRNRPAPFVDDADYGNMFMQVDMRLIGVLLVIDMGNRNAARTGLAPVEELLSRLKARSDPTER